MSGSSSGVNTYPHDLDLGLCGQRGERRQGVQQLGRQPQRLVVTLERRREPVIAQQPLRTAAAVSDPNTLTGPNWTVPVPDQRGGVEDLLTGGYRCGFI